MLSRYRLKIIFFFILVLLFTVKPIFAQYRLVPPIIRITRVAGSRKSFNLYIRNESNVSANCEVTVQDMQITPFGVPMPAEKPVPRGCSKWINLKPENFELKPKETKRVRGQLSVPRRNVLGGYYALITCEIFPQRTETKGGRQGAILQFTQKYRQCPRNI